MRNLYGMSYVVKRLRITTEQDAFIRAYSERVGISFTHALRNIIEKEIRRSNHHRLTTTP